MTFREKLTKEHPEQVGIRFDGGCAYCPYSYGYEDWADRPCAKGPMDCTVCWGREYDPKDKLINKTSSKHTIKYSTAPLDRIASFAIKTSYADSKPQIKTVKFNPPATIIFWKDGSKTVVKCQEGDLYNPETGFALAYLKKLLGNDNTFNKEINKWVTPFDVLTYDAISRKKAEAEGDKIIILEMMDDIDRVLSRCKNSKITKAELIDSLYVAKRQLNFLKAGDSMQ